MDYAEEVRSCLNQLKSRCEPSVTPVIAKLERLTDELTDQIQTLSIETAIPAPSSEWDDFGLTQKEGQVAEALKVAGRNGLAKERLFSILYSSKIEDAPDFKIIDVWICRIRRAIHIESSPYFIETIWGRGYRMLSGPEAVLRRRMTDSSKSPKKINTRFRREEKANAA